MPLAPKVHSSEIMAYTDAQLDAYLDEHDNLIHVHTPKNLTASFITRLTDRGCYTDVDPSHAQMLTERLQQICAEDTEAQPEGSVSPGHSPRVWTGLAAPLTVEERLLKKLGYERRFYEKLIKHGGRPWYPIKLMNEVANNPHEHADLLRYWQGLLPHQDDDHWMVFGQQWKCWKDFCEWRDQMRTKFKGRLAVYYEKCMHHLDQPALSLPFVLKKNPEEQDKFSTWVEYMAYEYIRYCRVSWYRRRKTWYEDAWEKLVDSGVLYPGEAEEFIHSDDCTIELESEGEERQQAVEDATSALLRAHRDVLNPAVPGPTAKKSLAAAEALLDLAMLQFGSFKKRSVLVETFRASTEEYVTARASAESHVLLLEWLWTQVPEILREMDADAAQDKSDPAGEQAEAKEDTNGCVKAEATEDAKGCVQAEAEEDTKGCVQAEGGADTQGQDAQEESPTSPGQGVASLRGGEWPLYCPSDDDADSESESPVPTSDYDSHTSQSDETVPNTPRQESPKRSSDDGEDDGEDDGSPSKRSRQD